MADSRKRKILRALAARENWTYGLELVRDGAGDRGTIYVQLQELEEAGFVRSREEKLLDERLGARRRIYEITSRGRAALLRDDL